MSTYSGPFFVSSSFSLPLNSELNDKSRPMMLILDLVNNGDLVDRDIRDPFVFVPQIQHAVLYINDVTPKRRVRSAGHIDLLSHQLF